MIRKDLVPVPAWFVAEMVAAAITVFSRMPSINPVDELADNPDGSPLTPKDVGLLLA